MNPNRFKRMFLPTNPEKSLRNLPGAQKSERRDHGFSTVRVKGHYIPPRTDTTGKYFGFTGLIYACFHAILLPYVIFANKEPLLPPLAALLIGFAIVHGCALFADGLRHSESPRARRGILIFWASNILWLIIWLCNTVI